MLDVNFRDYITSEWVPNYQTNEAEDNVIIEKFEKKKYIYIGDVWWSYSWSCRSVQKNLFSGSILSLLKYVSLCNKSWISVKNLSRAQRKLHRKKQQQTVQ